VVAAHAHQLAASLIFADALHQLVALGVDFDGPGLACNHSDITLGLGGANFQRAGLAREAQQVGAGGNGGNISLCGLAGRRI